ncbi:hypothetical protein C5P17_08905 [Escherichia coli]|nr:hypothetical protein C5P17_08905 [Escherichia coli]PPX49531.1 hypothetical protein C5P13_09015 [Escherichia coli]
MRLWVRAPRTSILSIHLSRIKRFFARWHGATGDHKRLIMTQIDLNEYTVLECITGVLCNNVWPGLFPGTEVTT